MVESRGPHAREEGGGGGGGGGSKQASRPAGGVKQDTRRVATCLCVVCLVIRGMEKSRYMDGWMSLWSRRSS